MLSRRLFLPLQQLHCDLKQRSNPQHSTHHESCHDICNGSQISSTIHHGQKSDLHQTHPERDGRKKLAPIQTNNSMTSGVINGKVQLKKKSNGHVILLATRQGMPGTIGIYWQPSKLNYADYWTSIMQQSSIRLLEISFEASHCAWDAKARGKQHHSSCNI